MLVVWSLSTPRTSMSGAKDDKTSPLSPTLQPTLPCIVDGAVAVRIERLASVREPSSDHTDKDSGVEEEIITSSSSPQLLRQPVSECTIVPISKELSLPQVSLDSRLWFF